MKKAFLFEKKKDKFVRCVCCRHYCLIAPGNSGICGVRQNIDGELYLRVYGKPIAVHIDPIEKKPFYNFMPGAKVFSFGTIGCNFRCEFCQNWDISQPIANIREQYKDKNEAEIIIGKLCEEGQKLSPKDAVNYCKENNINIIAYTYNEPTIFTEYAADMAKLAKKEGIKNVYVTNGYESEECLKFIADWCDGMNIDIKFFDQKTYSKICGGIKLQGVLDTVKKAWEMGIWVECTTLVIPDLNDSDEELKNIADFIAGVSTDMPWHVTAFHPDYRMNDREVTSSEILEKAYEIGKKAGLKFIYTGNINGGHNDTLCPKCGEILIKRVYMDCSEFNLKNGKCPKCKEKISGIWCFAGAKRFV